MRTQITLDWPNRLWQGLVTLWSGAQFIAKRLVYITAPYTPGTLPFTRYCQRHMAQIAQERLRLFASLPDLPGLDGATKRRLLPLVRHCGNQFAATEVWHFIATSIMGTGSILVLFALITPIVNLAFSDFINKTRTLIPPSFPFFGFADWSAFTGGWLLLWPFYVAAYGLLALSVAFPAAFLLVLAVIAAIKTRYLDSRFIVIGWLMVGMTIYALWFAYLVSIAETHPVILIRVVLGGIASGLGVGVFFNGFIMMMMITGTSEALLVYRLERRRNRLYPEAAVTLQLLRILAQVTKHPAVWGTPEMKHELVARLEIIAECLEDDLPRRLQSDIATDGWFQQMAKQMAAALRALKRWVLMPKPDTREQFIARIADTFVHVAAGEWDALARSEAEPQTQRQSWRAQVTDVIRAVAIALLPLLGVWGIQQSPLAAPQPVAGYMTIGSLIWLVLTLLISLDASFHAKLRVMEDLTQSVPFLGRWLGTGKKLP